MLKNRILMASAFAFAAPAILKMPRYNANVLTNLMPDLFEGLDIVSRELIGYIPRVSRDVSAERVAIGELVRFHVAPVPTVGNTVAQMQVSEPADQTIGSNTLSITKSRSVPFGFVGEEQKGLRNGPGYGNVQVDMITQALRALTNEMEADIHATAVAGASRAYGTPGTTPFASTLVDPAQLRKILDDNGTPASERALIIDTTAGANIRAMGQLSKVSEAGSAMTLRDGELLPLHGFSIAESAAVKAVTAKGTAAGSTTTNAGHAIGATTVNLAAAGTGTILTGDIITFAGDANKYVVVTGDTDVSNGGTVVIAAPGLRVAIPAVATAITVQNVATLNVGFHRSAIQLVARAPAAPQEGDARLDEFMLVDPRSGMAFEITVWAGQRKVKYEVAAAWGTKATKSEFIGLLLG